MLEIIILIIVVLLAIAVMGFISHQRNQKLASDFERELDQDDTASGDFHARYDAVLSRDDDEVDVGEDFITLDGEKPRAEVSPATESDVAESVISQPVDPVPPETEWDLVIALTVIVGDILINGVSQVGLTEGNELIQTLFLDGADESFAVGIQIRTPGR